MRCNLHWRGMRWNLNLLYSLCEFASITCSTCMKIRIRKVIFCFCSFSSLWRVWSQTTDPPSACGLAAGLLVEHGARRLRRSPARRVHLDRQRGSFLRRNADLLSRHLQLLHQRNKVSVYFVWSNKQNKTN